MYNKTKVHGNFILSTKKYKKLTLTKRKSNTDGVKSKKIIISVPTKL